VQNFSDRPVTLDLAQEAGPLEALLNTGERQEQQYALPAFGVEVFLAE